MTKQLVQDYFNEIDRLRKYSGTSTEGVISEAFKDLLKAWSRQKNLVFVAQYEFESTQKNRIRPDGTILHDLRVPLGHWEAKDEADDLDGEIEKKLRKGYPQDNIIFEDSREAVLIQNRAEVMRCRMTDADDLLRLLSLFFGYERQEIADFRKAVAQFKTDLPAVLDALRDKISAAYADNTAFKAAADRFLQHAKDTINPTLGEADVREMLIQHILTEEIFSQVFDDPEFHRKNNIAHELYVLEETFFTGATRRDTLNALKPYYATIKSTAQLITRHSEKQSFLKVIYENFYKIYDKKKADTLGVVYTPNEIVKFMIDGADWLTQKHFGKALIDEGVEILDPATGTGTFICELLEHFRGQPDKLKRKYKEELHANEVAILPYYVANLNIEATYAAITGQYAEFPNLCFVDTLDNIGGLGIKRGHQHDLFAGLSDENIERVKRQNRRKISVIIGNPPYNANQQNENDNNKNRAYPHIDELIKRTYVKRSNATWTKLYDMYARFFRWASDRLSDHGIVAFVTNRSFIDGGTFDGFRRTLVDEFSEVYVIDLGGDVRANPKLSGTKNNVFGIQTGVAITFLVKRERIKDGPARIYYSRRPEFETAEEKLAFLANNKAEHITYERVKSTEAAKWINQPALNGDWDGYPTIVDRDVKGKSSAASARGIFGVYSLGVNSGRDEWAIGFSPLEILARLRFFAAVYNEILARVPQYHTAAQLDALADPAIKWTRELKRLLGKRRTISVDPAKVVEIAYRPFVASRYFYDRDFSKYVFRIPEFQPTGVEPNAFVMFPAAGATPRVPFSVSGSSRLPDLNYYSPDPAHAVARYRYASDGARIDNITDWGLKQFQKAYGVNGVLDPARLEGGAGEADDAAPVAAPSTASAEPSEHSSPGLLASSRSTGATGPAGRLEAPPPQAGEDQPVSALRAPSPARGEGKRRQLTKDDIFHYVYAVLHDPVYREKYALNLKREFPRIPFYRDFWTWVGWGEKLMALHIGYESVELWPLQRLDTPDEKARAAGVAPKAMLKADKDNGTIRLDSETQLTGVPAEVWTYKLGNRSGVEWVLDQYKEKTPKDPTIREKFNTYRFADYKEKVIDLIGRVTRVSVETVKITEAMKAARR